MLRRWLGRLGAAIFVGGMIGFAALVPDMRLVGLSADQQTLVKRAIAQVGQVGQCPLGLAPKIVSTSSYLLTAADRCDLVVLTSTSNITVQLPSNNLIFPPGWISQILPINGGQVSLQPLNDPSGRTHTVNLQPSILLSAGAGAELRVLQDSNWYASARFSGTAADAVAHNVLRLYPPRGTDTLDGKTAWSMTVPDLSQIDTSTTCSSGVNEAEAYAYSKGWPVEIYGDGEYQNMGVQAPPRHRLVVTCAGGIQLNPLANRYFKIGAIQIQCSGGANAGCLNADSMMKGSLLMSGTEIVVAPTAASTATCGVLFRPHTAIPSENLTVITDSDIEVGNVAIQPASGTARAAVCFNVIGGGIVANRQIRITEPNGGGSNNLAKALADVAVFGADTGVGSFAGNNLVVGHPHSAQTAAILIGENTTNASRYGGNQWQIGYCDPSFTGAQCVATFGSGDKFTVGLINASSGPYQYMAYAQQGAQNNTFDFALASGASGASGLNPGFADFSGAGATTQWLNNFLANGKPFSVQGDDGQPLSGLAPANVTNGTVSATSTITRGVYTADNSSPTGFTIGFPFTRNGVYRGCVGVSNVSARNPVTTAVPYSTSQISFTANGAMATGTAIFFQCW